jgi:hypothetical protein
MIIDYNGACAAVHYDLVIWRPMIELDGEIVTERGNLKFSVRGGSCHLLQ